MRIKIPVPAAGMLGTWAAQTVGEGYNVYEEAVPLVDRYPEHLRPLVQKVKACIDQETYTYLTDKSAYLP